MGSYFAKDKARLDWYQLSTREYTNWGMAGWSEETLAQSAAINSICRRNESRIRERQFETVVLANQDYASILCFAPEDRRCSGCDHWQLDHTEYLRNAWGWTPNNCVKCLDNEMGPCTFNAYSPIE